MLLYTAAQPKDYESYQERGDVGFTDVAGAQIDTFMYEDLSNSRERNLDAELWKEVHKVNGLAPELFGPKSVPQTHPNAPKILQDAWNATAQGQDAVRLSDWEGMIEPNLEELRKRFPDANIRNRDEIDTDIASQAKAYRDEFEEVYSYADPYAGFFGTLGGGVAASMADPINIMTLPLGAGRVAGASFIRTLGIVAARNFGIGVASEGLLQPFVYDYKQEINSPYELTDALFNMAAAGIGEGLLNGLGHTIGRGFDKLVGKNDLPDTYETRRLRKDIQTLLELQTFADETGAKTVGELEIHLDALNTAMADIQAGRKVDYDALGETIERQYIEGFDVEVDGSRATMDFIAQERFKLEQEFDADLHAKQEQLQQFADQKLSPLEVKQAQAKADGSPIDEPQLDAKLPKDAKEGDDLDVFDVAGNKHRVSIVGISESGSVLIRLKDGTEELLDVGMYTLKNANNPNYKIDTPNLPSGGKGVKISKFSDSDLKTLVKDLKARLDLLKGRDGQSTHTQALHDLNAAKLELKRRNKTPTNKTETLQNKQKDIWAGGETLRNNEQADAANNDLRASRRDEGDMLKLQKQLDDLDKQYAEEAEYHSAAKAAREQYVADKAEETSQAIKIAPTDTPRMVAVKSAVNRIVASMGANDIEVKVYEGNPDVEGDLKFSRGNSLDEFEQSAYKSKEYAYDRIRNEFLDIMDEDADIDLVMENLNDFSPEYRRILRALDKEDWLGFDVPSQALNAVFSEDQSNFEFGIGLKSAIGRLVNIEMGRTNPNMNGNLRYSLASKDQINKDSDTLSNLAEEMAVDGVELDVYIRNGGEIYLSKIALPKDGRGEGAGTAAMSKLIDFANRTGRTIALTPDLTYGATSIKRLKKFYTRLGFVNNTGKNKDFSFMDSMYRKPSPNLRHSLSKQDIAEIGGVEGVTIKDDLSGKVQIEKDGKPVGEITYEESNNVIQIKRSDVSIAGKGIGTNAYAQFIAQKINEGKVVTSDNIVSTPAQRVYEKLNELGFTLKKADDTRLLPNKITTLSREDLKSQRQSFGTVYDKESGVRSVAPGVYDGPPVYTIGLPERYSKSGNTIEAAINPETGELHINASAFRDEAHLMEVLREEVIGHYGLRKSLGKEFQGVIDNIKSTAMTNPELRQLWIDLSGVDPQTKQIINPDAPYKGMADDVIADEIISKMAREEISDTTWLALKNIIIKALRKIGLVKDDITISEMKALVLKSEKALKKNVVKQARITGLKPQLKQVDEPLNNEAIDAEAARIVGDETTDRVIFDDNGNTINLRDSLIEDDNDIAGIESIRVCML